MKKINYTIWMALVLGAFVADAKTPQRSPDPAKFPRYKTDGTVPNYDGEALPNIMIFLVDDMAESNDLSGEYPEKLSAMVHKMNQELTADKALYPVKDGEELKPIIP